MGYSYRRSRSYNNYHLIFNIIIPVSVLVIVGLVLYYVVFANTFLKYSVEFYDGETLHASIQSSENEEIDMPSPPSKECRVFEGWYYDDNTFKKPFSATDFVEFPIDKDYKVYAKWSDYKHTPGEWEIVTKASCTSEGLKTLSCTVCDAALDKQTIEMSAHKASTAKKEQVVKSTCVTEGSYLDVVYCSVCNYKMSETKKITPKDPAAHSFDSNYSGNRVYPTVSDCFDSFTFDGVCKLCSTNISKNNIDVDVKYDYNCLADGEVEYIYEICGSTFSHKRLLPQEEHILNGLPASYWTQTVMDGGVERICYSSSLTGIYIVNGAEHICGNVTEGVFLCESCDKYVGVNVVFDHKGEWKVSKVSTCTEPGEEKLDCSICKTSVIRALPLHNFVYNITDLKLVSNDGYKSAYDHANLIGYCLAPNCTATNQISYVSYKFTVNPTCVKRGTIQYSLASIPSQTAKVTSDFTSHTIFNDALGENVYVSNVLNKDGSINSNFSDLVYISGSTYTCGSIDQGYFICRKCSGHVLISIYNVHNGVWVDSKENPPSCTDYGQQIKECVDCGTVETRTIAPLGHEYAYELVIVSGTSTTLKFNVERSCNRSGCTFVPDYPLSKDDVTKAVKKEQITKVSCGVKGVDLYKYSYVDKDTNVTYDLTCYSYTAATGKHKLSNGKQPSTYYISGMNNVVDYRRASKYITLFGDDFECESIVDGMFTCKDCKMYVLIQVSKLHDGTWTEKIAPTCYSTGLKVMGSKNVVDDEDWCSDCGYVEEELPMLKHDYKTTLEENDGNFTFKVSCGVKECTFVPTSKEVTPTSNRKIAATCSEEGRTVYTYKEKIDGIEVSASCNADFTEKAPHTVCCTNSSHKHTDDEGNYLSTVEGVVLDSSVDESSLKDGDVVDGGFLCKKCDRFIKVKVKIVK